MPLIDLIDWDKVIIVSTALFVILTGNLRFSLIDSLSKKERNTKTLFPIWRILSIALLSIVIIISSFIYTYKIVVGDARFNLIPFFGIGFFLGISYFIDLKTVKRYIFCPKCSSFYSKVYSDKLIGIITKDEIKVFEKGEEQKLKNYGQKFLKNIDETIKLTYIEDNLKEDAENLMKTSFIVKREIKCKKCNNIENLYITIWPNPITSSVGMFAFPVTKKANALKVHTDELIKSKRAEMLASSFNFDYLRETIKLYPAIFEIRVKDQLK